MLVKNETLSIFTHFTHIVHIYEGEAFWSSAHIETKYQYSIKKPQSDPIHINTLLMRNITPTNTHWCEFFCMFVPARKSLPRLAGKHSCRATDAGNGFYQGKAECLTSPYIKCLLSQVGLSKFSNQHYFSWEMSFAIRNSVRRRDWHILLSIL